MKRNVLIIIDKNDSEFIKKPKECKNWNIFWYETGYKNLYKKINEIKKIIIKNKIDFILYSRNEQISKIKIGEIIEKLHIGYSSFSGIDDDEQVKQMTICFNDFLSCNKTIDYSVKKQKLEKSENKNITFSLIFDLEQFGGARFGLSRILDLLYKYKIPATFFVTNIISKVYKNLPELLLKMGHEIGIHGLHHEYLSNYGLEKQTKMINEMVRGFGKCKVIGANFIGRMNKETIDAMIENSIEYFVYPVKNTYKTLSLQSNPIIVSSNEKTLWLVPISVETYNKTWLQVKGQIDNTMSVNKGKGHFIILLHPFYDGSKDNIKNVERIVKYLSYEKNAKPIRLDEKIKSLQKYKPESIIKYEIRDSKNKIQALFFRLQTNRIIRKYHKLEREGKKPAIYLG